MPGGNAFSNKVVLVTGASGGIGRAIARRLAGSGASVALAYGANPKPAQQLADELAAKEGHAVAVGADLRDADAAAALLAEV